MDNFIKFPKIYALGRTDNADIFLDGEDDIVIEEKIDGGNLRFAILKGNIVFGSRNLQITSDKGINTKVGKGFDRTLNHIREALKGKDLSKYEGYMFFGEACHKHTLSYNWDRIPPFLGFDIMNMSGMAFLTRPSIEQIFGELDLDVVPLIKIWKAEDIHEFSDKDVPVSAYAPRAKPDQKAEGVCFKNQRTGVRAKYVRAEFKEENADMFGGTPKYLEDDSGKIVLKYCVNARIDKVIFKLVDEGNELDMPLMKYLPTAVYKDIMEEHWEDIVFSKMKIDFHKCRIQVTKRCLCVLKQVLVNNSLETKGDKE